MEQQTYLEEKIVAALRRILRAVSIHSRQLLNGHGVTAPQLLILNVVSKSDGISLGQLARTVSLSQSTTSDIVRRLAKQGLVEQRVGQDRRSRLVRPTADGLEKLRDAPSLLQNRFQAELAKRDDYRQTQILATLQEVAAMMEATDIAAAPILATDPLEPTVPSVPAEENSDPGIA